MSVSILLEELRSRDIRVWTEGDQLRCTAPTGVLTPALRDQLRQEKNAIVEFLRSVDALARQDPAIVPLQPRGRGIPVFAAPGHNGNVFSLRLLAQQLGEDRPFFGLQPPGVDGECDPLTRIEELAAYFVPRIRAFQPDGPIVIAGHCAGGTIAFELARQLQQQGASITFVALFGSAYPTLFRWRVHLVKEWLGSHLRALAPLSNRERRLYIAAKFAERRRQRLAAREAAKAAPDPMMVYRRRMEVATMRALSRYTPLPFAGSIALFAPNSGWLGPRHPMLYWRGVANDVQEYCGPDGCQGDVMLKEPHVRTIAEQFQDCLRRIEAETATTPPAPPPPTPAP